MSTAGPTYTGTGANNNDGGTTAWTNPTNIQGDTTATAATVAPPANGNTSQQLFCSNFGFSIPSGANILGITVEVEQAAANANRHRWNEVKLLKAGAVAGSNLSDASAIPTSKAFKTFGGSANLWGTTLTQSDVNDSGFGVSLKIDRNSSQSTTTSLSRCRITVTYADAITGTMNEAVAAMAFSVTATEEFTGTGNEAMAALAFAVAAAEVFAATGNEAIAALAFAGSGMVEDTGFTATAAVAWGPLAFDASGVYTPQAITGTGDETVAALAISATGKETFSGSGGVAFGKATWDIVGGIVVPILGSGEVRFAKITVSGSGVYTPRAITGTGVVRQRLTIFGQMVQVGAGPVEQAATRRRLIAAQRRGGSSFRV